MRPRTERRFEDCDSQWTFTLFDSPISQDDNPFPVSRPHVPRQLFELVKSMLLGHDLSEQRQRLFGLVVQMVAPQLTVVTSTSARSGVAVLVKDAHAASVVPREGAGHETTAVRAASSNDL